MVDANTTRIDVRLIPRARALNLQHILEELVERWCSACLVLEVLGHVYFPGHVPTNPPIITLMMRPCTIVIRFEGVQDTSRTWAVLDLGSTRGLQSFLNVCFPTQIHSPKCISQRCQCTTHSTKDVKSSRKSSIEWAHGG